LNAVLDFAFVPTIAVALQGKKHDVVSAQDFVAQIAPTRPALMAWAVAQQRAIVTADVPDFRLLHEQYVATQRPHWGIVFAAYPRFSLVLRRAPELVSALETFFNARPAPGALASAYSFL
jgi:hypothetical protein